MGKIGPKRGKTAIGERAEGLALSYGGSDGKLREKDSQGEGEKVSNKRRQHKKRLDRVPECQNYQIKILF